MSRSPLALCYNWSLQEWRAVQTSNTGRGQTFGAVLFLRDPSEEEYRTVLPCVISDERVCTLGSTDLVRWLRWLRDDMGVEPPMELE